MSRHTKGDDARRDTEQSRARRNAQKKKARKPKRPEGARYADPNNPEHRNLRKDSGKNGMVELEAFSRKSTRKSAQRQKSSSMKESLRARGQTPQDKAGRAKRNTRHRKPASKAS